MLNRHIAILGANSHIAKGLIYNYALKTDVSLRLFTRDAAKTAGFLKSVGVKIGTRCFIHEDYQDFLTGDHDVVINCVGAGAPNKLGGDYSVWFTLTEEFDNLCLNYLQGRLDTLYVNFSSGAVYGRGLTAPVTAESTCSFMLNRLQPPDYYALANLNAEAKHRSLEHFRIVDIRIFSYFSRFIDLDSGYFITEALKCALTGTTLRTDAVDIVRDYLHPDDLFGLIRSCVEAGNINGAFDAMSARPVRKFEILELLKNEYGLCYEIISDLGGGSPNGFNAVYCSSFNEAAKFGHKPTFSSTETLMQESSSFFSA
jgi:nucleoside-diphosphate-sugar epimerase